MKKWNKYSLLILLLSLFIVAREGYCQEEVDSLLEASNKLIYENPDEAILIASRTLKYPNITIRNRVNALLAISTAYSSIRDYEGAAEYVTQVENLIPEIDDDIQKLNVLNRIAAHFQELQIYDKAMEYLDMALELIVKYPNQDSIQSFLGYNSIVRGFIYREQTNCDIALKYFDKAIAAYKRALAHKPFVNGNLSICYYNKGNCLLSLNEIKQAKESYQQSLAYAQTVNAKSLIAFAQKGLAGAETATGNIPESISLLNDALETTSEVGDRILNRGIYKDLARNYLLYGDWNKYTLYQDKYLAAREAIKNSERKTINQSLLNLTQNNAKAIDQLRKYFNPFEIAFYVLNILVLLLLLRTIRLGEKKLKNLQNKLKS